MSVKRNKDAFREIVLERRSIRMYDETVEVRPASTASAGMEIYGDLENARNAEAIMQKTDVKGRDRR